MSTPQPPPDRGSDAPPDAIRISKTMAFLLRHRPDVGNLTLDDAGWVALDELCLAVGRLLRAEVEVASMRAVVSGSDVRRFEIAGGRIRALQRVGGGRDHPPDILYLAATRKRVEGWQSDGVLTGRLGRSLLLAENESAAWRAAHRLGGSAQVLYIDTSRAHRQGVRFQRNRRNGLFMAERVPVKVVLNLLPRFAEQLSAGGIPLQRDEDGRPLMALIKVARKSGVTWEVAKGKLEPGEPPEHAALREVREEMGVDVPMRVTRYVDTVRYGFLTPSGEPRLKSVFVYLMEPQGPVETFVPMTREGIGDVRWFAIAEACRAVTHSSLIPVMSQVRRILEQGPTYAAEARAE